MSNPTSERKAWAPDQDKRGLECRHCGCGHFRVVYTRQTWGGRIVRRRECRHCGKRMTTWERAS
jgi:hypothetical protein